MSLVVTADPHSLGFDAERLQRIGTHFRKYVDDGRLPSWSIALARHGELAYVDTYGHANTAEEKPMELDTIVRAYSMTKPITAVAAMILWEQGAFALHHSVRRYIPAFGTSKVWTGGTVEAPEVTEQTNKMELWHLLTHTAGLTYGFMYAHPVDAMYRAAGFDFGAQTNASLEDVCNTWAQLPLLFQPGTEWNYSVALDVVGRVIEIVSGMSLDEFFRTQIFEPLGMTDTAFFVPEHKRSRLAHLYHPTGKTRKAQPLDALAGVSTSTPTFLGGGGGLATTLSDYHTFAEMLRGNGMVNGTRILGSRTVEFMRQNHLPGGVDLSAFGRSLFSETTYDGVGFGLGMSVTIDPVKAKIPGRPGEYGWGGAASTTFFVDPLEDISCVFLTQLLPSSTHPISSELKQLVNQALID